MLNKCEFIGRLTKDPELKQSSGGKSFCLFSLAVTDGYGKYEDRQFPMFMVWEKRAESLCRYCHKGSLIYIDSVYQNNPFKKNEQGYDIPNPQFSVKDIKFLVSKNSSGNNDNSYAHKVEPAQPTDEFVPIDTVDDNSDLPF